MKKCVGGLLILLIYVCVCLSACGDKNDVTADIETVITDPSNRDSAAVAVEKTSKDTVNVSFTDEILNEMGNRNEIRMRTDLAVFRTDISIW